MPKYFFNIYDRRRGPIFDREGVDLPNINAAREEAKEGARQILADAIRSHKQIDGQRIEIIDGRGALVGTVIVRDLLA
jgi:hypothetical protein